MVMFKKFMEMFYVLVGFVYEDVRELGLYERFGLLKLFFFIIIGDLVDFDDFFFEIDDEVNGFWKNVWLVLIREFVGKMKENKDLNFFLLKWVLDLEFVLKRGNVKWYENRYEMF